MSSRQPFNSEVRRRVVLAWGHLSKRVWASGHKRLGPVVAAANVFYFFYLSLRNKHNNALKLPGRKSWLDIPSP